MARNQLRGASSIIIVPMNTSSSVKKILDYQPYYETTLSNSNLDVGDTWEKSSIRLWLNGYGASYNPSYKTFEKDYTKENFIDTAFTAEEKSKIIQSEVPAHKHPDYDTNPGKTTKDKIFLLSIVEANKYFTSNEERKADATRYAVKQGVLGDNKTCTDDCNADWWLRSLGGDSDAAASVYGDGSTATDVNQVLRGSEGVRPAMWVKW